MVIYGFVGVWMCLMALYLYFSLDTDQKYRKGVVGRMIIFTLLGVQLLIINYILYRRLKAYEERYNSFSDNMTYLFKRNRRHLTITLIFFSISYLILVIRNAIFYARMLG